VTLPPHPVYPSLTWKNPRRLNTRALHRSNSTRIWAALLANRHPIISPPTKITEAKANLKTILATRVSYNDPNIVDVLIKPNDVSKAFVKTVMKSISEDQLPQSSLPPSATRPSASKVRCTPLWYVVLGIRMRILMLRVVAALEHHHRLH
jgi:hypothetical protein